MDKKESAAIYLKGAAMGCADAIPGVSGATIALITGIYQRLIRALTPEKEDITEAAIHLNSLNIGETIKQIREMDLHFLAILGAGIATALLLMLNIVNYLMSNFFLATYGFFFGLIGVSGLLLLQRIEYNTTRGKLAVVAGFLISFTVSGIGATSLGHGSLIMAFSGVLAISAMVLPGISGSLMLIMLGQYEHISTTVSKVTEASINLSTGKALQEASSLAFFCLGAVIGLFTFSYAVERALLRYRQATMALLVGMMLGALRAPVLKAGEFLKQENLYWMHSWPEFGAAAIIGGLAILALNHSTEDWQ
jgi:putative membrane protein